MNWTRVRTIVNKDWQEVFTNKNVLLPMLILPIIFVIILPAIMLGGLIGGWEAASSDIKDMLHNMPPSFLPPGLEVQQQAIYLVSVFMLAPFFLIIPVMTASVIAGNSFVGEKERKTIEGLLYTPVTDQELMMAKVLSAFVPAIVITWVSFIAYGIMINAFCYPIMGNIFFPTPIWWALMVLIVPAVAFIAIAIIINISERAKSFMEAQQFSGLLVMPIVLLVVGQSTGLLYLSLPIVISTGVILAIIAFLLFKFIANHLNRENLISKFT